MVQKVLAGAEAGDGVGLAAVRNSTDLPAEVKLSEFSQPGG